MERRFLILQNPLHKNLYVQFSFLFLLIANCGWAQEIAVKEIKIGLLMSFQLQEQIVDERPDKRPRQDAPGSSSVATVPQVRLTERPRAITYAQVPAGEDND